MNATLPSSSGCASLLEAFSMPLSTSRYALPGISPEMDAVISCSCPRFTDVSPGVISTITVFECGRIPANGMIIRIMLVIMPLGDNAIGTIQSRTTIGSTLLSQCAYFGEYSSFASTCSRWNGFSESSASMNLLDCVPASEN